jgi:arginine exporter protein ArgO
MVNLTVRKAMRYFVLTELIAIAIIGVGFLLQRNAFIISAGLLVMMGGMVFVTFAGNLIAQERMLEATEEARQEQEHQADQAATEVRGRNSGVEQTDNLTPPDRGDEL